MEGWSKCTYTEGIYGLTEKQGKTEEGYHWGEIVELRNLEGKLFFQSNLFMA
jgi:hypothetical protein